MFLFPNETIPCDPILVGMLALLLYKQYIL